VSDLKWFREFKEGWHRAGGWWDGFLYGLLVGLILWGAVFGVGSIINHAGR
jgi:hypothetical protein